MIEIERSPRSRVIADIAVIGQPNLAIPAIDAVQRLTRDWPPHQKPPITAITRDRSDDGDLFMVISLW
jgi:hypothetical protein